MPFGFRYPDKPFETSPAVVDSLDSDQWIAQSFVV